MVKEFSRINFQLDSSEAEAEFEAREIAFWGEDDRPLVLREDAEDVVEFDLEERTALFGEQVIEFAKTIPDNSVNRRLISQLVGAGTSVGANYCEATEGVSKKDFKHKIGICKKEAKETRFFLRMIAKSEPNLKPEARVIWQEARELHLIFAATYRNTK